MRPELALLPSSTHRGLPGRGRGLPTGGSSLQWEGQTCVSPAAPVCPLPPTAPRTAGTWPDAAAPYLGETDELSHQSSSVSIHPKPTWVVHPIRVSASNDCHSHPGPLTLLQVVHCFPVPGLGQCVQLMAGQHILGRGRGRVEPHIQSRRAAHADHEVLRFAWE